MKVSYKVHPTVIGIHGEYGEKTFIMISIHNLLVKWLVKITTFVTHIYE